MKQARGERTVQRVLDAALELHERGGRSGFTVQAICAATGTSAGSLYHHFGSLDGLGAALYKRCMAELLDSLVAALNRTPAAPDGIRAVVVAYLTFAQERPAAMRFIHTAADQTFLPAFAREIAADKAPRLEAMLGWLRAHQDAGRIAPLPPALVEVLLIGPAAETTRRWLGGQPGVDLTEAAAVLPERVWSSLRP